MHGGASAPLPPVTFEGRPTGRVPWDWLSYFHQRRPACHIPYHDPATRAHPVIPTDAVRVVRAERELEPGAREDGPRRQQLQRRVRRHPTPPIAITNTEPQSSFPLSVTPPETPSTPSTTSPCEVL